MNEFSQGMKVPAGRIVMKVIAVPLAIYESNRRTSGGLMNESNGDN